MTEQQRRESDLVLEELESEIAAAEALVEQLSQLLKQTAEDRR